MIQSYFMYTINYFKHITAYNFVIVFLVIPDTKKYLPLIFPIDDITLSEN
jgi:hypothetical protein